MTGRSKSRTIPDSSYGKRQLTVTSLLIRLRGPVVTTMSLFSIIGYALLISPLSPGAHYAGCFLVALGLYVSVGIPLAWLPSNCPRYGKRTTAIGLQLTIGNSAGIMSSFVSHASKMSLKFRD